jgi:hypothetical protein
MDSRPPADSGRGQSDEWHVRRPDTLDGHGAAGWAVAVPMAAWGLEQAAQRLDGRNPRSVWPGRLRQAADWLAGWGQGPLADRLRRPTTTVTRITKPDGRPGVS